MLAEDLTRGESEHGEGWQEKERCVLGSVRRNILKHKEAEEHVLSSPLQPVALGMDVPCICQARVRPRLVGPEQEVEGLHLQVVVVVAEVAVAAAVAAAAVEGDLQTHPRVTCHCWKQGLGQEPLRR